MVSNRLKSPDLAETFMIDDVNIPEIVAEVTDAFTRYNQAIETGDSAVLNSFFWNSPLTVRFGPREHLFGYDQIANFRTGVWKPGAPRALESLAVITFGRDFGSTNAIFRDTAGVANRQSQVWARTAEGWRIAAAHVSPLPD
jgi:hypothetical protein